MGDLECRIAAVSQQPDGTWRALGDLGDEGFGATPEKARESLQETFAKRVRSRPAEAIAEEVAGALDEPGLSRGAFAMIETEELDDGRWRAVCGAPWNLRAEAATEAEARLALVQSFATRALADTTKP